VKTNKIYETTVISRSDPLAHYFREEVMWGKKSIFFWSSGDCMKYLYVMLLVHEISNNRRETETSLS